MCGQMRIAWSRQGSIYCMYIQYMWANAHSMEQTRQQTHFPVE